MSGRLCDGKSATAKAQRGLRGAVPSRRGDSVGHQLVERQRLVGDLGPVRARSWRRCSRPPRASTSAMRCRSPRYQRTTSDGLLVALRHLLDVRLQLLGPGLQVVGAHQLADDEAEAHARSACGWKISAGIGAVSASFTPRFFRSARAASIMRSTSPATSAFGTSSSAALTSASITLALLRAITRNLTSRSRFRRTSARSASTRAVADAERLGERLVDLRQVLGLDLLHA